MQVFAHSDKLKILPSLSAVSSLYSKWNSEQLIETIGTTHFDFRERQILILVWATSL